MSAELLSPTTPVATVPAAPAAPVTPIAAVPVRRALPVQIFRQPAVALLAMLAAVIVAYAPCLGGQFLWDDSFLVKNNPLIRSPLFCLEVFRHTLFNGDSNFYRPAQMLTYIADYWFWGLNPFGYHLSSILVQALNGWLLFLVLRRVLPALLPTRNDPAGPAAASGQRPADWIALAVSLLWVVHPVHSAAVAYISGRADSLAMCFCLSAWLLCERALAAERTIPRLGWGAGAFGCLLLGLCSKEIAFVWLVLFTIWLFVLRPGSSIAGATTSRRAKLAVAASGVLALLLYVGLRHLTPPPPVPPPYPAMPARWLLMLRALGDYGSLMIFPGRLFMERQVFPTQGQADGADAGFYLSLAVAGVLVLAAFAAGAWLPGRGQLLRRCGAGWFLIGFLPVSNLFALNASVAEHWLYLPSIGFLLFAAGVAVDVPWRRVFAAGALPPAAATAIVILAAGALGARTWLRAHDWVDRLTFYQQTIRDGGDVPRAREGLALAFTEAHDDPAATELLRALVGKYPHALTARVNLATSLLRQNQLPEAKAMLEAIAADLPGTTRGGPREVTVVVRSLDKLENDNPAWPAQRRALVDDATCRFPESWELVQLAVQDRENSHAPAEALALVAQFADAHWWHAPARSAVGRFQGQLGRDADALAAWKQAARLDIYDTAAFDAAAAFCLGRGRSHEAVAFQRNAVHRQPQSPRQHILLAEVLEHSGQDDEAASERKEASRLVSNED